MLHAWLRRELTTVHRMSRVTISSAVVRDVETPGSAGMAWKSSPPSSAVCSGFGVCCGAALVSGRSVSPDRRPSTDLRRPSSLDRRRSPDLRLSDDDLLSDDLRLPDDPRLSNEERRGVTAAGSKNSGLSISGCGECDAGRTVAPMSPSSSIGWGTGEEGASAPPMSPSSSSKSEGMGLSAVDCLGVDADDGFGCGGGTSSPSSSKREGMGRMVEVDARGRDSDARGDGSLTGDGVRTASGSCAGGVLTASS